MQKKIDTEHKASFIVKKDLVKDYIKKCKGYNIAYPKYESVAEFNHKKVEFDSHDSYTYTTISFDKTVEIPEKSIEYSEDYASQSGDMVILKYRKKGKAMIVTSIEIIGFHRDKVKETKSKGYIKAKAAIKNLRENL